MAGSRYRSTVPAVGLALIAAILVGCTSAPTAPTTSPTTPSLTVTVQGSPRPFAPGTTLGDVIHALDLRPKSGRLLSVGGDVLEPRADPGEVALNGAPVPRGTVLGPADVVTVTDGSDRVEGTEKRAKMLGGRHPGDPQYSLGRWKLRRVRVVGRISGQVASLRYIPTGRPDVHRQVALSFDDGPWPTSTRRIVKILKHHHVKATFFMIGENVARWPAIARDVVRAGMTVGNHSWDHPETPTFADLEPHRLMTELTRTNDALRSVGVKAPFLFRPPGGSWDAGVVQAAQEQGLRVVNWNVDPQDWRASLSAKEIAKRVLSNVRPGSIVDLHDGGGNQSATVKALPMIIKGLRKHGYHLVAIPH
jgi:peptidoglycan/xylan/chitin deacetylase (PgdA/CDA1 family)/sulfur carrier protein ThiS